MSDEFDAYDLALITALAEDASLSAVDLSKRIHLSRTATARRIQALIERGLIEIPRASVDFRKLGFSVHASIQILKPKSNSFSLLAKILERPEILSVSVGVGRVLFVADSIFRDSRHLHRFLSWLEELTDSETTVIMKSHRSEIPVRERLRLADEFLATEDSRFR